MKYDVAVLGGGAAGLMCAIEAGRRGRRVVVIERSDQAGKKILISGGGRCNFTNLHTTPGNFLSANPHFCRSALARYTPADFIALVERHRIAYHEKEAGQLFCDLSARLIVEMLLDECRGAGVRIELNCRVTAAERTAEGFALETSPSTELRAGSGPIESEALVVATGGLSIPKMGATPFGYQIAQQFGHTVIPPRAGLVPLTWDQKALEQYGDLAGISLPVEAGCNGPSAELSPRRVAYGDRTGVSFAGGMLFTHRGISGPAILQLSSYWRSGDDLWVNFLPGTDLAAWLAQQRRDRPGIALVTALADLLPRRLAQRLCEIASDGRPLRQYQDLELRAIAGQLQRWPFRPAGTEGYRTAEVTVGGVNTDELSSTTMASKKVPGLYFVGELVDVTGHLGGHNFQWAWASGHVAGQVA